MFSSSVTHVYYNPQNILTLQDPTVNDNDRFCFGSFPIKNYVNNTLTSENATFCI